MDALKLIPQVFFDVIGRVVPGSLRIFLWLMLDSEAPMHWDHILRRAFMSTSKEAIPTLLALSSVLGFGYVLGHILSPITKFIQAKGEWLSPLKTPLDEKHPGALSKSNKYEWLRLHRPEAGAHCA